MNVLHKSQVEPSQFLLLHGQGQGGHGGGGGGLSLQHCQVADVQGEVGGGAGLREDVLQAGGEVGEGGGVEVPAVGGCEERGGWSGGSLREGGGSHWPGERCDGAGASDQGRAWDSSVGGGLRAVLQLLLRLAGVPVERRGVRVRCGWPGRAR